MSDGKLNYRPEIDGLRALAVVGVLLFHLDLGVSGGFVGVDVFFVISGYLISGIVLRELDAGTFSLKDFWVRRIRRIFPALFVVMSATLLAGFYLLSPVALEGLAEVAIAQMLLVSNFIFASQGGYFTEAAEASPLLHVWSLAVEEQFYVVLPLLFWVLWRLRGRRLLLVVVAVAGAVSFGWSCYQLGVDEERAFFLLPSRAWELLFGVVLAVVGRRGVGVRWGEVLSATGVVMIVGAMVLYDGLTPFPGLAALLPVVGAGLFILGNVGQVTCIGRVLAWRPVVFVGLISYSLYLWHWPLLVYSKYVFVELGVGHKLVIGVLSLVLATLSWRYVERPFRRGADVAQSRVRYSTVAVAGVAGFATVMMVGVCLWLRSGVERPVDAETQLLLEDVDWHGGVYVPPDISDFPEIKVSPIGARDGEVDFLLWGDSHAMAVSHTVNKIAKQYGARGETLYTVAVQPVTGVFFQELTEPERDAMLKRNEAVVAHVLEKKIPHVILVGRWVASCIGFNAAEIVGCKPMFRLAPMVIDEVGDMPSNETSTAAMKRQLAAMCHRLHVAGVKVWVMRQVPETIHLDTAKRVANFKRFPLANKLSPFTVTRAEHEERRKPVNTVFEGLDAEVLDPTERFFAENGRLRIYDERAYYRDDDHLTRAGADYYLTPMFERVFKEVVE